MSATEVSRALFNPMPGHCGFSQVGTVLDDAAGRRIFSGVSRLPRSLILALLHSHPISPSYDLQTSLLRATQSSQLNSDPEFFRNKDGRIWVRALRARATIFQLLFITFDVKGKIKKGREQGGNITAPVSWERNFPPVGQSFQAIPLEPFLVSCKHPELLHSASDNHLGGDTERSIGQAARGSPDMSLSTVVDKFFSCYRSRTVNMAGPRSPPTKANRVPSPPGSLDFRKWESCRTMALIGGFSRGSPVSPGPSFQRRSMFTSITLIGSQDLAVKSRPNLFTSILYYFVNVISEQRQPFHELSNGFRPLLTSPHPESQFVPKMFYRVKVGSLGGPVQSTNIVVGVSLHSSP
ncbi:hypothetical protein PR048_027725 [Dryococelus australis]|uniref:Uncharacterized protein n=1 Tax=Dryococelus australis TaxID=614101 RepID=A0ABQ9GHA8_9NEOP|nr:hypothetical protein PR048_027725 [Dryococelus australis]